MSPPAPAPAPPPPRFSWPMRLLLGLLVFDMVFHSLAVLTPYLSWCKELGVAHLPDRLPTREERARLRAASDEDAPDPAAERVWESADDVWRFWRPWPGAESRRRIDGAAGYGKFYFCWATTRLGFLEQLVRAPQRWTMFSPNVGRWDNVVRARLVYEDGSAVTLRNPAEPQSAARYESLRFLSEKKLQYATKLEYDEDCRLGYCNLLAHRHPDNAGSPLVQVQLVIVSYAYPPPGVRDRAAFLRAQDEPDGEELLRPFYEYDVASRRGYRPR
jgi:hypothetical protein